MTVFFTAQASGFQTLRPGRLPKDLRVRLRPGLQAVFQSLDQGRTHGQDARVDRLPAIAVARGEAPSALLSPGPFAVEWTGYLKLRLKGTYQFFLSGRGQVSMEINGTRIWDGAAGDLDRVPEQKIELVRGYNRLRIRYQSLSTGAAQLRVDWSGSDFAREPMTPQRLLCDSADRTLESGRQIRRGRFLVARLHCFDCHGGLKRLASSGMPELNRRAPDLVAGAGGLRADWIVDWLLDPQRMRNRSSMPRLLHGLPAESAERQAADLAAYLLVKSPRSLPDEDVRAGSVERGEALFEDRGCIGCHRFTAPGEPDEWGRLSLHFVAAKFQTGRLSRFLVDPEQHYAWTAMPNLGLTLSEATDLEVFLRQSSKGRVTAHAVGEAARGEKLFNSLGCQQCHLTAVQMRPPVVARVLWKTAGAAANAGCLAVDLPANGVPAFALGEAERMAIATALQVGPQAWRHGVASEFAQRQVQRLRCTTCHQLDGEQSTLGYILDEEAVGGHPPEAIPELTWVGDKLRRDWTRRLLAGQLGYRAREHLRIQMPAFLSRAEWLSRGLAAQHGYGQEPALRIEVDPRKAAIGAQLAAMDTGMSCHRCHPIADRQPQAPFDARSTNLVHVAQRLRRSYYRRWMLNPQRIDPATKMLRFAPDGKRTSLRQYYEGDAMRQFDALWHYLQSLHQPASKGAASP
ncbi:MAG: PA14 domain-containing protein [Planctomycetota bacterium]|nr:PA14 domain-containing protein [Planctomycetota bacterium]